MLRKLKSVLVSTGLFFDYVYDNIYRVIEGIPRLKRSQITAHLFLGSQYNRIGLEKLKALGITAIVNMRTHNDFDEASHKGIKYLHLPTPDNTAPPLDVLIKGADFIDEEIKSGGSVYVHCRQGLGRGPTMAVAYLLKTGLTFDDAFQMVKKVRVFINPQRSQIERLKELAAFYADKGIL